MSSPTIWSAGRYEAVAQRIANISEEVLDAAEKRRPLRDIRLVDLACVTGNAALSAAARGARVTGVDITPELLALGAQKAGGATVNWVTADASDTGLPAASFDAAVSNMGIVFVEPTAQVAEIARLLAPGATLAFSTWVRGTDNPFYDPIVATLGAPPDRGYSPDQWGEPAIAEARLAADFDDVSIRSGWHTWQFASHTAAMTFVTDESPMHVDVLGRVPGPARDNLVAAFDQALRAHSDDRGAVSFDVRYAVVTATRR